MPSPPSRAGDRSVTDGTTPMGIGTTRELERVCAAMGMLDAAPLRFESADDLPNGGTLCALPALLAFGLLDHQEDAGLSLPKGFYSLPCIFLLIALLALARIPSVEQLRYESPGEWGRLLGLDRIPEVRTLREKIARLAQTPESVARWAASLATSWMERHEAHIIGTLLVDGHTRVYHGSIANLPKRYISRERLCLRATTDYWVNALDGAPLFCVTKPVDPGLQKTLENDIIPRLLNELPHQPGTAELAARPLLHRFTVVFDREGYSPALFARLKQKRIAILTYHKHPGENWSPAEFNEREVELLNGEKSHPAPRRARHLAGKRQTLAARNPAARRPWPPDRHPQHRLPTRAGPQRGGDVRQMASGKLFQIHARTLRVGPLGRARHQPAS